MKTIETQWLMVMNEFGLLDNSQTYKMNIGLLGDIGEAAFDRDWLGKFLSSDVHVVPDFWFDVFDQIHQIDYILFNQESIELVDIKNFEGNMEFKSGKFYVNGKEMLRNPISKAEEHVRFIREWLRRNQLPDVPIHGNLVFINKHARLDNVPKSEIRCLMPNDIRNYLRNIHSYPGSYQSDKILNAFLNNDGKNPYLPPVIDHPMFHYGWRCPVCRSRKYYNEKRHFKCACGGRFSKERYAVQEICKYGVMYHHKELRLIELFKYFNGIFSYTFLNSCLRNNFVKIKGGYQNPRQLVEYYQPNKKYRYEDIRK